MSATISDTSVVIEECSPAQAQQMLEDAAQMQFGKSWSEFFEAYQGAEYRDTEQARAAEELAFLAPFAG